MKPSRWNRTRQSGRHGAFAPVWSMLLAVLFYGAQLGPEMLDGLVHLQRGASQHPTSAHYEDPGKQSHSDHCLVSHARGESRALPALAVPIPHHAPADSRLPIPGGEQLVSTHSSTYLARAPPRQA